MAPNFASQDAGRDRDRRRGAGALNGPTTVQTAEQVRDNLIDDTESTDWQAAATQSADGVEVDGKQVTIDLAGTQPQRINRVQVSALLGPVFDRGRAT